MAAPSRAARARRFRGRREVAAADGDEHLRRKGIGGEQAGGVADAIGIDDGFLTEERGDSRRAAGEAQGGARNHGDKDPNHGSAATGRQGGAEKIPLTISLAEASELTTCGKI